MKVVPILVSFASGERPHVPWSSSKCSPRDATGFTIHMHFINTMHVKTSSKTKTFLLCIQFYNFVKFDLPNQAMHIVLSMALFLANTCSCDCFTSILISVLKRNQCV